jgi:multidrug transporter EmrE-like cation transporter
MPTLLAILAGALTVAGNVAAKQWAMRGGAASIALTLACYIASSACYVWSLRSGVFTAQTATVTTFVLLASSLAGLLLYKDAMTASRGLGLVFAVAAIALLAYPQRA